jgi:hypothetical protein
MDEKTTKSIIKIFAEKAQCGIQHNFSPCNSCFHAISDKEVDFRHVCWCLLLAMRGDYKGENLKELLEHLKEEVQGK